MIVFPEIKINLGLFITSKRGDGYHDLLSCFYPVGWTDILEIVPSADFEFIQTGEIVDGNPEDNVCLKAYRFLKEKFSLPNVRIHLHKILPMGAGLGGGSSDAAYTLKCLNSLFNLNISSEDLHSFALHLGSDCPFFIDATPAIASSRGEVLEKVDLNLKGIYILIVCPGVHVSTKEAFAGVKPTAFNGDFKKLIADKALWKKELHNQFEDTIFPLYPQLKDIKSELY